MFINSPSKTPIISGLSEFWHTFCTHTHTHLTLHILYTPARNINNYFRNLYIVTTYFFHNVAFFMATINTVRSDDTDRFLLRRPDNSIDNGQLTTFLTVSVIDNESQLNHHCITMIHNRITIYNNHISLKIPSAYE
jgi:hypothetical protein